MSKDKEFWEGMKEWDIVILTERWLDEKRWENMKEKIPKEYSWKVQTAIGKNKKGRTSGGMLLELRKEIEEIKEEKRMEAEKGRIKCKKRIGEERWRIIGVYVKYDIDKNMEDLKDRMEEGEKRVRSMIGGDFNARIGEEGWWIEEDGEEMEGRGRRSKDKKINGEGRKLEYIEKRGWTILNGNVKRNEEEEFTYTRGKGETIIDYVLGEEKIRDKVERLEVGERVDSDYHPLVACVTGNSKREWRERG